jgi:hypothetical protein
MQRAALCRYDVTWQRGDINLASKMCRRRCRRLITSDPVADLGADWRRLLLMLLLLHSG